MAVVPAGTFLMGDFAEAENEDALPLHDVLVARFLIDRYEVSYVEYDAFATKAGLPLPDDDGYGRGSRAVANVTWDEAMAFCSSRGMRLPSEAEWEYAARSGGRHDLYSGTSDPDSLGEYARYKENSVGFSAEGGRKLPNELGIYDMSGNVAEWVGDYYQFFPRPGEEPVYSDLEVSGIRIVRGGYFDHPENILRTYWRTGTLKGTKTFSIGFRCAVSLE